MVETIEFAGNIYPRFQSEGNAARFAIPYAMQVCKGEGFDIGYCKPEWKLPGAIGIDLRKECISETTEIENSNINAIHFPVAYGQVDYIFSSHCLEHLDRWVDVLDYWYSRLKVGGVLFLYLPDFSQVYWHPWNNRKHVSVFTPEIIKSYFISKGFDNIFISGVDLNNSFMIFGEK